MIDLEILGRVPLLKELTSEHLALLQPLFKRLCVKKGTYVLKENTTGDQFYLLTEGTVQVTKDLVKGFDQDQELTEKVLATIHGKDLQTFGENGVLGHGARTANIISVTDCTIYTLSKADFESFAQQNFQAAYLVMRNIAIKIALNLKSTDENLVKLATALYIAVQH